jgi:hypothetical protein
VRWGVFTIFFALIGQWSVFQFLRELFGSIMGDDEIRIPRRTEGGRKARFYSTCRLKGKGGRNLP